MTYPHRVDVLRNDELVENATVVRDGYALLFANLRCLVQPMDSGKQQTILGDIGEDRFFVEWPGTSQVLMEGDRVEWHENPVGPFLFHKLKDDRWRGPGSTIPPYQTGWMEMENIPKAR